MFRTIPFEPGHIPQFLNYGGQDHLVLSVPPEELSQLNTHGEARTGLVDNRIVGCAGLIRMNDYRAVAWGLFQRTGNTDFLHIHMAIRRRLRSALTFKRIEAFVNPLSPKAMRWIALLGFRMEQPYIPYYFADGSGAAQWAMYPNEVN